ncbi:general secretion pathway protein GspK [Nocardia otitidiscaviarum]|uniref:general secretion pathway protein GspK n=1 Tax=Nocardia otitidiscaviarum TaxID=1823 RepID=UPI001E505857|nr:general secretion pathway protein GspK [Nocardia otitidiscaviarum]
MPTFQTPNPITVAAEVLSASVTVIASDRADTVVEVRPADPVKKVTCARPRTPPSICPATP